MRQEARVTTTYEMSAKVRGKDGFEIEFIMNDSLRGWWSIVRWNFHYRHWRALATNSLDLFRKVIRSKIAWRRS